MLHQTFLFLGQLWQLFEVSQILEFLRYIIQGSKQEVTEDVQMAEKHGNEPNPLNHDLDTVVFWLYSKMSLLRPPNIKTTSLLRLVFSVSNGTFLMMLYSILRPPL